MSVDALIIDIGGSASRLADALLDEGFKAIAVLDLSEKARSVDSIQRPRTHILSMVFPYALAGERRCLLS